MNNNMNTVFFGGLTQNVTTDNLQQWTEMFGEVSNIRIIPNKKNPSGLTVGFVDMADEESMQACIEYYKENPLEVEGIKLTVTQAKEKKERTNNFNNHRSSRSYEHRAPRRYAKSEGNRSHRSDDNEEHSASRFNDRNDHHSSSKKRNDYKSDRRTSNRYNNFDYNDGLYEYEAHRSNRSYNRYND